jgi:hypothetical protein
MTPSLVDGDHASCSRVGGAMRRESARLSQHAQLLDDALDDISGWDGTDPTDHIPSPIAGLSPIVGLPAIADLLRVLRASAEDLDRAGAALQRYATDLAESHELGRRAELRVEGAGLILTGTRVIEPWGPATAQEAERRRAQVPSVQARVDLAMAHVGRARGRLEREMTQLTEDFSGHRTSRALCSTREA